MDAKINAQTIEFLKNGGVIEVLEPQPTPRRVTEDSDEKLFDEEGRFLLGFLPFNFYL